MSTGNCVEMQYWYQVFNLGHSKNVKTQDLCQHYALISLIKYLLLKQQKHAKITAIKMINKSYSKLNNNHINIILRFEKKKKV